MQSDRASETRTRWGTDANVRISVRNRAWYNMARTIDFAEHVFRAVVRSGVSCRRHCENEFAIRIVRITTRSFRVRASRIIRYFYLR